MKLKLKGRERGRSDEKMRHAARLCKKAVGCKRCSKSGSQQVRRLKMAGTSLRIPIHKAKWPKLYKQWAERQIS